jgi:hypothetical protein
MNGCTVPVYTCVTDGLVLTLTVTVALGLAIVAEAVPVVVLSTSEIAEIVTVAGEGTTAGAWNRPLLEIVPTVELPPATPLTNQFTLVLEFPVTVVVYCWSVSTTTVAVLGATVTVIGAGASSRMRELSVSATNSLPAEVPNTPDGKFSSALVAGPPSPEKPGVGNPAVVAGIPATV